MVSPTILPWVHTVCSAPSVGSCTVAQRTSDVSIAVSHNHLLLSTLRFNLSNCTDIGILFFNCIVFLIDVDGACFGTGFAHIFLMTFDDLVPCIPTATYVPRVFGFKIHASSNSLPKKVVVLDLNSQSDADSSNQLASSGENEETERGVGVQVVFDLTAEQQPQPSLLSTKVVGNPRLSLQGPPAHLNDANNGNTTVSAVSTVSHHHSSNHSSNHNHPPSNSGSAVHILPPPPRQQEYPPEAYYDALARHNGNNGNGSFHAHPAPSTDDLQQEPSKRARTQL